MEFGYATIMTWMKYLDLRYWHIKETKLFTEEEIISKFNDLFKNELAREGTSDYAFNPYKGIGYMTLSFDKKTKKFIVDDKCGYMTCFYSGINDSINGKKLALNKNIHGFNSNYFKFVNKEDDEFVFVRSVVEGKCKFTPNIRRLINALYLRQQPICEQFKRREVMFLDYSDEEKEEIIKESQRY